VNKNLKEFWDEICLPENLDIREKLFGLDYTWIENDPNDGDNRFKEMQEELEYVKDNDENFIKTHHGWGFNYVVKNADWLFIVAGEAYGILFDNAMVERDTEFDAGLIGVQLHNYPFRDNECCNSWEELIEKNLNWCPDFSQILNKYLKICEKHDLVPCLGNSDGPTLSQEEFDTLVYKDFKGE
jgi:hypothetical protein